MLQQLYLLGRHLFDTPRISDTHNTSAGNASDPRFWTGLRRETGDGGDGLFEEEMSDDSVSWKSCPCDDSAGFLHDAASGKCFMKDRVGRRFENARANCANFSANLAAVDDSDSLSRAQGISTPFKFKVKHPQLMINSCAGLIELDLRYSTTLSMH